MFEIKPTAGGVSFAVRVVPRASRSEVVGIHADALKISLAAPPVDGAANAALCELLADVLKVPLRTVSIRRGERAKLKTVEVQGIDVQSARRLLRLDAANECTSPVRRRT